MADNKSNVLLNNNNMVQIYDQEVKQEYDADMQVKLECDYEQVKTEISINTESELYADHIIKEELVIGPEIIQTYTQTYANVDFDNVEQTFANEHNNNLEQADTQFDNKNNKRKKKSNKSSQNKTQTKIKHKNKKSNDESKSYVCDSCNKTFDDNVKMEQHLKECTCPVCGKHFSFQSNMLRHLKIHTGNKKHKCPECNVSFIRKDYLDTHIVRHHSLIVYPLRTHKPSVCKLCGKSFARKHSRDFHLKYSCPKNPNKVELKRTKWYICDICKNKYAYRSSLSSHIQKRHMGRTLKKINECDYCGKKYVKKHNLQCHIQWKHLKIKPYLCKICGKRFKWHSIIAKHQKRDHDML